MKVTCPSCGAKYAIADDKVRGRRVKVRCKSCTTPIVVDGAALEAESAAMGAEDEATRMAQSAAGGVVGEWSVNLSDTDQRQMTTEEIIAGWQSGSITEDAFVWNESMDDWKPVLEVPELASRFFQRPAPPASSRPPAAAAPPWQAQSPSNGSSPFGGGGAGLGFGSPPAAASAPTAARVSGGRSQRGGDLFGMAARAGSEEEVAQHAAAPGSTPYVEQKPTGARNENSVLFSLDALKAGFAPSAQSAAPAPAARSKSSRPPAAGDTANLDDLMNLGGTANPIFGLGANQALLHAPPPPEPPPPPPEVAPASLVPAVGYAPAPQKSNKSMMIALAAAVVVILVLGVGLVLALGGGDEEKVAQKSGEEGDKSGSDKSSSGSSDRAGDKSEGKQAEGESKPGDDTPAAGDDKTPVTEEDKKRFAEAQKKKEEEEKGKTEEKKDEPDKKSLGTFSRSAAVTALTSAASAASGCKRPGGPTGTGKAIVTFAPSGRVTSANVTGGSFGGTSVGGCIASVFRNAKIPPFDGDPVTVSKSFTISP